MRPPAFPTRPVRYVVPFRPGGPPDAVARLVVRGLSARWDQPVTVDNRPGISGASGTEFVVHSPPDGHTILQGTSATHSSNAVLFPMLPYDPVSDMAPVVPLIEGPLYLAASPRQPVRTLAELLDLARGRPGELRFATAGGGSPHHLAGELLKARTGIDIVPVHYAGAAQALRALVNDDVELYFGSDFSAHPQAAAAHLLGVSTPARWPSAPHVPTFAEQGIADFEIHGWFGLFLPAATPGEIVSRLNAEVNLVLRDEATAAGIRAFGYRILGGSAGAFAERLERERRHWAELVRRNNLTLI